MNKKILLINDMPGYGKVALATMIPILSTMGHSLFHLPTALVSNTLDYGKFEILDTTQYMEKTLPIWNELGFSFDCISTGFILSAKQVELILSYIQHSQKKVFVMVDPIMGDAGKLYNGVKEDTVDNMRKLGQVADIIVPNFTEACFLSQQYIGRKSISQAEAKNLIDYLLKNGSKSVVITSVQEEHTGKHYVCGYSEKEKEYFFLPYHHLPIQFPGTGDIFSSILLGSILHGSSLKNSAQKAMDTVYAFILKNKDNQDKFRGIVIEECLELIKN